ncbi:MAG: CrcB family protein [Treponema sp.]|nr:CrcB family protein [Treponema sp.]
MSGRAALALDMVLVFLGGGLGSVFRWAVARLSLIVTGTEFPWATLAVNLFGCLAVGFVVGAIDSGLLPARARPLLVAGFIGGMTTFSTYAYGIFEFGRRGHFAAALAQFGLENVAGIGLVIAGYRLAAIMRG